MSTVRHGAQQLTANAISVLDSCDTAVGWSVGAATENLAVSANHVEGRMSLSFDKIAGAVTASVSRTLKKRAIIQDGRVSETGVRAQVFFTDLTDVTKVHIDLGSDVSHYSRFTILATYLTANEWCTVEELLRERSGGYQGRGLNTLAIEWMRVSVEFGAADNTLVGMLVDGIVLAEVEAGGIAGEVSNVQITGDTVGLAKETTLSALSAKLPAALGQAAMAASMSVAIASDQSNVPVDIKVITADVATQTTLASVLADTTAILAKIVAAPALDATVVAGNALLATIDADTSNLDVALSTVATQTTLASVLADTTAILAKLLAAPATEALQTTGNTSLASILSDTTAILAKIVAAPALDATIVTGNAILTTIDADTGAIKTAVETAAGESPPLVSAAAWESDVYAHTGGGGAVTDEDIGAGAPTGKWHICTLHPSVGGATILTLTEETSGTVIEKWDFGGQGGTVVNYDPRWPDLMPTTAKKLLVTSSNDVNVFIKYRMYDA